MFIALNIKHIFLSDGNGHRPDKRQSRVTDNCSDIVTNSNKIIDCMTMNPLCAMNVSLPLSNGVTIHYTLNYCVISIIIILF